MEIRELGSFGNRLKGAGHLAEDFDKGVPRHSFYVGIIDTEDDIRHDQRELVYVHEQPSEVLS